MTDFDEYEMNKFGCFRCGYPGRCDVQRAGRVSPDYQDRVGSRGEESLRDPDDGNAEFSVDAGAKSGPAVRCQVHVAVDDQQFDSLDPREDRANWRQLTPEELPWHVPGHLRHKSGLLGKDLRERPVAGQDKRCPRPAGAGIVNVYGSKTRRAATVDSGLRRPHALSFPDGVRWRIFAAVIHFASWS